MFRMTVRQLVTWQFITAVALSTSVVHAATEPAIIPQPVAIEVKRGSFTISNRVRVVAGAAAANEAARLIDNLAPAMGFRLERVDETPDDGAIVLTLNGALNEQLGEEGYTLDVTPKRIDLLAAEPAGLFYAVQTLRQLLPPQVFSTKPVEGVEWTVPCVEITDYPRFRWRGLLIDPARYFIPVTDVKHFIDAMALHKYNRLQMHLTDNEGWRVEIKKYPKLTEIGSKMDKSRYVGLKKYKTRYKGREWPRCFGFYTQDDIRELVRYAAERHVTIVPEIEMPYHAGSAIVAYPEHGVNMKHLAGMPSAERWKERRGDWRPNSGLLGPRPATVAFMQDILGEVLELFPSQHIHIGGDEANLNVWVNDTEMQALMKELGCKNAHELHSRFIKQIDAFLTRNGRRMVGWDEILQGGLAPGATVMSWHATAGGIAAAHAGHDAVMTPTSHVYFDYRQHPEELGLGKSVITLEKVYSFDPIPASLDEKYVERVLGGQGLLWGELIADRQRRDFMAWPRACALSETLWSHRDGRDLDTFLLRVDAHLERLAAAGIGYRPLDRKPMR